MKKKSLTEAQGSQRFLLGCSGKPINCGHGVRLSLLALFTEGFFFTEGNEGKKGLPEDRGQRTVSWGQCLGSGFPYFVFYRR